MRNTEILRFRLLRTWLPGNLLPIACMCVGVGKPDSTVLSDMQMLLPRLRFIPDAHSAGSAE